MSYADRCVICGEIIPEGRQVCPICEERTPEWRRLYRKGDIGEAPKERAVNYET